MKEKLRDKTRDDLNLALRSLGVDAEMAERGRPEEKVGKSLLRRSLRFVDIRDRPISAINVIKQDRSQRSPPFWWAVLLIPPSSRGPSTTRSRSQRAGSSRFHCLEKSLALNGGARILVLGCLTPSTKTENWSNSSNAWATLKSEAMRTNLMAGQFKSERA